MIEAIFAWSIAISNLNESLLVPVVGESRVLISGRAIDQAGKVYGKCKVDLLISRRNSFASVDYQMDYGKFNLSLLGPAGQNTYVVEVACEDSAKSYRSAPVDITGKGLIRLGDILLPRKPKTE